MKNTFDELSLEQQIAACAEGRKFSPKQVELGVFLVNSGAVEGAIQAGNVLEGIREFNRMVREQSGDGETRVPKVKQIIDALQSLRDSAHDEDRSGLYLEGVNDSIATAGRFV